MLAAAPNWAAIAALAAIAVAFVIGAVLGWQSRGYHENSRRGNDVDLTGVRR